MSSIEGDEAALIADAQGVIGDTEVVRQAGVFTRSSVGNGMLDGDILGGVTGAVIGGLVEHQMAKKTGATTLRVIVAVTDQHIHVINWGSEADPDRIAHTFDRATTKVTSHRVGPGRSLKLRDKESGVHIKLDGGAAKMLDKSGPDASVFDALAS